MRAKIGWQAIQLDSEDTCRAQQDPLRHAIVVKLVMKFDKREERLKFDVNAEIRFLSVLVELRIKSDSRRSRDSCGAAARRCHKKHEVTRLARSRPPNV